MSKGDILIAEDDAVLRSLYVKKFTVNGYSIRTAADGDEALRAIHQQPPDLLVLDIHMPKVDGFQVLQSLPAELRTFPVILLTNFGDEKTRKRGDELGADDYFIKKDMTIRTLLEKVEKIMQIRKYQKYNRPAPPATPAPPAPPAAA